MTTATDWTGPTGDVWAAEWRRTDRSLAALSLHLDPAIRAAAPPRRFRALDVGAGAGATSLALAAARPDAAIVAIELSPALAAVARARATEAGAAIDVRVGDAVALAPRLGSFDLIVSRHGVMFFADPLAAFTALRTAASAGARLVFSCFRDRALNGFAHEVATAIGVAPPQDDGPGPFAFADRDRVSRLLDAAGWAEATATAVDVPYRVGDGVDPVADALSFLCRIGPAAAAMRMADQGARRAMVARLAALLERRLDGGAIEFAAATWIWSARA